MTRTDIEAIFEGDDKKDRKYVIIYRAFNSINGNDIFPIIAKRKEINVGFYIGAITLSNKRVMEQIQFSRIISITRCDDCTFGTC